MTEQLAPRRSWIARQFWRIWFYANPIKSLRQWWDLRKDEP